jgi:hypothetical protein
MVASGRVFRATLSCVTQLDLANACSDVEAYSALHTDRLESDLPVAAVTEPIKEAGMRDYRLDAIERPKRHPAAIDRLTRSSP